MMKDQNLDYERNESNEYSY